MSFFQKHPAVQRFCRHRVAVVCLVLLTILICVCYGIVGLIQWIRRKKLFRVDADIILLGICAK